MWEKILALLWLCSMSFIAILFFSVLYKKAKSFIKIYWYVLIIVIEVTFLPTFLYLSGWILLYNIFPETPEYVYSIVAYIELLLAVASLVLAIRALLHPTIHNLKQYVIYMIFLYLISFSQILYLFQKGKEHLTPVWTPSLSMSFFSFVKALTFQEQETVVKRPLSNIGPEELFDKQELQRRQRENERRQRENERRQKEIREMQGEIHRRHQNQEGLAEIQRRQRENERRQRENERRQKEIRKMQGEIHRRHQDNLEGLAEIQKRQQEIRSSHQDNQRALREIRSSLSALNTSTND